MQDLRRSAERSRIRSRCAFKNRSGPSRFARGFSCGSFGCCRDLCGDRSDFQSNSRRTKEKEGIGRPVDSAQNTSLGDKVESALTSFAHAEGDFFNTAVKEFDSLVTWGLTPDASANNNVEKAAVGAGVVMTLAVPGGEGESLTRLGTSAESAARLGRKAAEAEGAIGIHGVSASAAKLEGEVSRAARSEVERVFNVHNTPTRADALHRTIELPKPVTRAVADIFNKLFGRGI